MIKYKIPKWKGIKKGDLTNPNLIPDQKGFWAFFFNNYLKPRCQIDNSPLELVNMEVSRTIQTNWGMSGSPTFLPPGKADLIIEVSLRCPVCGAEYSGIGSDLEIFEDGIGLGSFKLNRTVFNISKED